MKDGGSDFQAWTLSEALERVPNSRIHLRNGELLAWGRLGDPGAEPVHIPSALWLDSSLQKGWKAKAEIFCSGSPVFDLRIFPVLEAPNAAEQLGHISLKEVFNRFVIGDPEVQHLAEFAIAASSELRRLYRPSERNDHCFWPLDPDDLIDIGELTDEIEEYEYFARYACTAETNAAQKVLRQRHRAMIGVLQSGRFVAVGDPVRERDPQEILPTIWGAPGYHLDRRTGDLLRDRDWGDEEFETTPMPDNSECYEVRWRAILLKPAKVPSVSQSEIKACDYLNKYQERSERCFGYLCKLMKESPHQRPKPKRMIFRDAKAVCGGNLGWPIFCEAWDAAKAAVPEAVEAWSRAGAPRKSY
jgi:hypothetical protein